MSTDHRRQAYEELCRRFDRYFNFGEIQQILVRDMQTMMPPGAETGRLHQMGVLADAAHDIISAPDIKTLLEDAAANADALSADEKADLAAMRQIWVHEASLPPELAAAWQRHNAEGERVHAAEKAGGDWQKNLPFFRKGLDLARQVGAAKAGALGLSSPYEGLIDAFSPGWRLRDLDDLFNRLEPELKKIVRDAIAVQAAQPPPLKLQGPFDPEKIKNLCREFCAKVGFDFDRGRIDFLDDHPTAAGATGDSRITGRIDTDNFLLPLYDLMHETGHGVYDQNRPDDWKYKAAGQAQGMDIHESQSLSIDFILGRSRAFCHHLADRARDVFNRHSDAAFSADNLYNIMTRVSPTPVRISMDTSEAEYMLHIILRYRLEKALIEGGMDAEDLPRAFDNGIEDMIGVRPRNNAEGCMQDVHWFCGYWGYFPSYALGFMAAAQMKDTIEKRDPAFWDKVARGDFTPMTVWLKDNIQSKGRLLPAPEIILQATGVDLDPRFALDHIRRRYITGEPTPRA